MNGRGMIKIIVRPEERSFLYKPNKRITHPRNSTFAKLTAGNILQYTSNHWSIICSKRKVKMKNEKKNKSWESWLMFFCFARFANCWGSGISTWAMTWWRSGHGFWMMCPWPCFTAQSKTNNVQCDSTQSSHIKTHYDGRKARSRKKVRYIS